VSTNSSDIQPVGALAAISAAGSKKFLCELANLRSDTAALRRFKMKFEAIFLPEVPWAKVRQWATDVEEEDYPELSQDDLLWKYWLMPLRNAVRVIWEADPRAKQWGIFRILEKFFAVGDRSLAVGPIMEDSEWFLGPLRPPSRCELLFQHLKGRTLRCHNSECVAPYFFAVRQSQKYCSETCAAPAQREFKRKWWAEHGNQWRRTQAAEQKRSLRKIISKRAKRRSTSQHDKN
jgi:hypothetical protein